MNIKTSLIALLLLPIFGGLLSCDRNNPLANRAAVNKDLAGEWNVTSYYSDISGEFMGDTYETATFSFETTSDTTGTHTWDILYTDGFTSFNAFNYTLTADGDSLIIKGSFQYNFAITVDKNSLMLVGNNPSLIGPLQSTLTVMAEKN